MSDSMIAYCGLNCAECPAYLAKQNDDAGLRAKTAAEWGSEDFPVSSADVNCDGCRSTDEGSIRWKWCDQCSVRACAESKAVTTCAECADYGCETLESFLKMAGDELRSTLEKRRSSGTSNA